MKKILFTLLFVFFSIIIFAQKNFNHWSIEPEFGLTKLRDITPVEFFNVGIGSRYMITQMFGARLSLNYTNIKYQDKPLEWTTAQLVGVANFGRISKLENVFNNRWNIIGGIGGNFTDSYQPTNDIILHRKSNFHLVAFVDNEFRISNNFFMTAGINVTSGINVYGSVYPDIQTTPAINFNVKGILSIGKEDVHADWYLEPSPEPTVVYIDSTKKATIINNYYIEIHKDTTYPQSSEYVYFNHDSYTIDKDGLENIEQSINKFKNKITIKSYCSNVGSKEYNLILSKKRAEAVKNKLVKLGIPENKIFCLCIGIDPSREYDMARRVQIDFE